MGQIATLPPVVLGALVVAPRGLLTRMTGHGAGSPPASADTQESAARARAIVMNVECGLGFEPVDREFEKLGYDIESHVPTSGKLRFLEVKGRISGAPTINVTRNEILYSLNKPEDFHPRYRRIRRRQPPRPVRENAVSARARLRSDERQLRLRGTPRAGRAATVTPAPKSAPSE
jgi:hypothetical protein